MASVIKTDFGYGGANLESSATGEPTLAQALRDGIDDMTDFRTKWAAILTKLDGEGGLGGGYVTAGTLNTQLLTKG